MTAAVSLRDLTHHYSPRRQSKASASVSRAALDQLSLQIDRGEMFGILGPNGSGKTTLFRLLSTLLPPQQGEVQLLGYDLRRQQLEIRRRLGVVFQTNSLDKKLTVSENIRYQAALYGLQGRVLQQREEEALEQFGLRERKTELCETLSGGLRRRVELAKSMIHHPQLLLLDEPSTGLDPAARLDLWSCLTNLRSSRGTTVVLTTHILEEAAKCDRLAILNTGRLVALDSPATLQATVGGDAITIRSARPVELAIRLRERFQLATTEVSGGVRFEAKHGGEWIAKLIEAFPADIEEITLGKPTLEDVFMAKTGHCFHAHSREVA